MHLMLSVDFPLDLPFDSVAIHPATLRDCELYAQYADAYGPPPGAVSIPVPKVRAWAAIIPGVVVLLRRGEVVANVQLGKQPERGATP